MIKPTQMPPKTVLKPPPGDLNHSSCVHTGLKHNISLKRILATGHEVRGSVRYPAIFSVPGELQSISVVASLFRVRKIQMHHAPQEESLHHTEVTFIATSEYLMEFSSSFESYPQHSHSFVQSFSQLPFHLLDVFSFITSLNQHLLIFCIIQTLFRAGRKTQEKCQSWFYLQVTHSLLEEIHINEIVNQTETNNLRKRAVRYWL